jgi:hypothetical protein
MARKLCRVNNAIEFEFDMFSERVVYNQNEDRYEPTVRFTTFITSEKDADFIINLMPIVGNEITSIAVLDPVTKETIVTLTHRYDKVSDVSSDFLDDNTYKGHITFCSSEYNDGTNIF